MVGVGVDAGIDLSHDDEKDEDADDNEAEENGVADEDTDDGNTALEEDEEDTSTRALTAGGGHRSSSSSTWWPSLASITTPGAEAEAGGRLGGSANGAVLAPSAGFDSRPLCRFRFRSPVCFKNSSKLCSTGTGVARSGQGRLVRSARFSVG